jgi:hypothetical protein
MIALSVVAGLAAAPAIGLGLKDLPFIGRPDARPSPQGPAR